MTDQQFRQTLVEICSDLGDDDLEKLKFLLKDETGSAKLETATMAIDLFSAIDNSKHVSLRDGRFLAECFCLMGRRDLVKMLKLNATQIEEAMENSSKVLPFRILLFEIAIDLTDKEYEQMKFYCGNTLLYKRKQLEKVKNMFDLFVLLERGTYISPSSTSVLKEMMRSLDRGELLDMIEEYQGKYPQSMDGESIPDGSVRRSSTLPIGTNTTTVIPEACPSPVNIPPTAPVHVYEMTAYPRGYCIIINNNNFAKMKNRVGTDIDARLLNGTFHKLGFTVKEYKDLTAKDMVGVMIDVSRLDHSKYNALVVCILTHGGENVVYGVDEQPVPIRYITMHFRSSKCKTLANKPKLFFLQACQGEEKQSGFTDTNNAIQTDGPTQSPESVPEADAETISSDTAKIIPDESDFLIGFATVTGYVSFRSRTRGSFYIKKLTENLNKYADSLDLITILTQVNHDVSEENIRGGNNGEIKKQVPMPQFTLRKQLYFSPDNLPPTRTISQPSDTPLKEGGEMS